MRDGRSGGTVVFALATTQLLCPRYAYSYSRLRQLALRRAGHLLRKMRRQLAMLVFDKLAPSLAEGNTHRREPS